MNKELVHRWYEQYKQGIYRYLLTITRNPQLAEDVLQDTFVKLLNTEVHLVPGKEQAWLYKTARNRCFDILKKDRKNTELPLMASVGNGSEWKFTELVEPLNPLEREIVSLKIIGGLTHKEIAKITGLTVSAAKKRYERAIQKLRDEMEELL